MKTITFPIPDTMLKTLKKKKCFARRIGSYLYEVRNHEEKLYKVQLSPTEGGFTYTCEEMETELACKSMGYPVNCRHAYSAALLCYARNEDRKRVATQYSEAA
jgi:hypothetical protein